MRWYWVDRFEEFIPGKYATSIKNVTMSDEPLDNYCPGRPYFPASLIVEALAQTAGILIGQLSDFEQRVVLAKINKSRFHFQPEPGDQMHFRAEIEKLQESGAFAAGTVHVADRLLLHAQLTFAYLDNDRFAGVQLFEPAEFCRMLRSMKLFDVGKYENGEPIQIPEFMIQAERAQLCVL